jgi:hypothetical protein
LRHAVDARDRGDVANKIVVEFFVERGVDHIVRADGEQRVAIWWRTHDGLSSDIAAGAGPVLNDELLTELLGEPLTYYARDDVNRLARGKSGDHISRAAMLVKRTYQMESDWRDFIKLCGELELPALPAPAAAVCTFITNIFSAEGLERAEQALHAVEDAHRKFYQDPTQDVYVRGLMRHLQDVSEPKPQKPDA